MIYGSQLAGLDWSAIFSAIPSAATATAIAAAWSPIVGGMPAVINRGDHYEVAFTMDQEDRASAWIISQLNKEPGPVQMDLSGVAIKVITRQYWPWVLGVAGLGFAAGYLLKGRG